MGTPRLWEPLLELDGTWEGSGEGGFPTIEEFTYREVLEVSADDDAGLLHYLQRTWRHENGDTSASHRETRFIALEDDETVHMVNAQGTDRVEVLAGPASMQDGVLSVELKSVTIAGDDRMVSSWRTIELARDTLRYTMGMVTTAVPDGAIHLSARLTRR